MSLKIVVKQNSGRIIPGTERIVKNQEENKSLDIRSQQSFSYPGDFGAPLDPRFTFDNFVVGKPNELACCSKKSSGSRKSYI